MKFMHLLLDLSLACVDNSCITQQYHLDEHECVFCLRIYLNFHYFHIMFQIDYFI